MNLINFIVCVALFVMLTPGILLHLPVRGSKMITAITHGIIFTIILSIIHRPLTRMTHRFGLNFMEGMKMQITKSADKKEPVKPTATATKPPAPTTAPKPK